MQNANSAHSVSVSVSSSSKKTKPQSLDALKKQGEKLNEQTEAKHIKNKEFKHIQTSKKCENLTQFISKYENELKTLAPNNTIFNIDLKTEKWGNEYQTKMTKYTYDKKFKNEKHMIKQIIKLIIDIVYYGLNAKNLRMKITYLLKRGFKFPFFLIPDFKKEETYYPITYIFNYIKKAIKGKDATNEYNKIFENVSEYRPPAQQTENQIFECIICKEDKQFKSINKNCVCIDNICNECFMHLPSPKTCPTCRKRPFTLAIYKADAPQRKRNFKFLYNNKTIEREFNLYSIDQNEIYYLKNGDQVDYTHFEIEDKEEMIKEFIDGELSENIKYFSTDFLFQYFDLPFSKAIFEVIMQNSQDLDTNDIMNLLGLTNDPEDETTLNFVNHCVDIDGLGHTMHKEIIDEIEDYDHNEDKIYYQVIFEETQSEFFSLD
jgi:hypothetical protein